MDLHRITARKYLPINNTTSVADLYQFLNPLPRTNYLRGTSGEPSVYAKETPGKSKDWCRFQGAILMLLENLAGLPINEKAAQEIRDKIRRDSKPLNVEDFMVVLRPLYKVEELRRRRRNIYSRAWEKNQRPLLDCMSTNEFNAVRKVLSRLERKFHRETDPAAMKLAFSTAVAALSANEKNWLHKARLKLKVNLDAFSKTTVTAETVNLLRILESIAFPEVGNAVLKDLQSFIDETDHGNPVEIAVADENTDVANQPEQWERKQPDVVADENAHATNRPGGTADRQERKRPAANKRRPRARSFVDLSGSPDKSPVPGKNARGMPEKDGGHAAKPAFPVTLEFFPEPPQLKPASRARHSDSQPKSEIFGPASGTPVRKASSHYLDSHNGSEGIVKHGSVGSLGRVESPGQRTAARRLFPADGTDETGLSKLGVVSEPVSPPTPYTLWEKHESELKQTFHHTKLDQDAYEAVLKVFAELPVLVKATNIETQRSFQAAIQDAHLTNGQKTLIHETSELFRRESSLTWEGRQLKYFVDLISTNLEPGQAESTGKFSF